MYMKLRFTSTTKSFITLLFSNPLAKGQGCALTTRKTNIFFNKIITKHVLFMATDQDIFIWLNSIGALLIVTVIVKV
jgi:hypothetical protein